MTDLELYRSYVNDFLTIERFAEFYGLTNEQAETAITLGREEHNGLANGIG